MLVLSGDIGRTLVHLYFRIGPVPELIGNDSRQVCRELPVPDPDCRSIDWIADDPLDLIPSERSSAHLGCIRPVGDHLGGDAEIR